ncbi:MAG: hypothetical protein JEY94_09040 [Melioribacteraceae bacterium]|nr:hypothetical protein [Melioribacteraceae bacterium]
MKPELYDNYDQKFDKLINDLKGLPKVKADDNFEFNLMTKIQNGQFKSNLEPRKKFGLSWTLIPSTAIALSAVILFFIISDSSNDLENPFNVAPQLRGNVASQFEDSVNGNSKKAVEQESFKEEKTDITQAENNLAKQNVKQQLANGRDLPLDNYINESPSEMRNSLSGTQTVSQTNRRNSSSVYIRVENSKEAIEKNKAKLDSLNKVMKKEDIEK